MPKHRQLLFFLLANPPDSLHPSVRQPDEVEDERVHHLVRQRVLFIEEHSDEERVGSGVFHVAQTEESGGGMEHGDGDFGQDRGNDGGLFQGASPLHDRDRHHDTSYKRQPDDPEYVKYTKP